MRILVNYDKAQENYKGTIGGLLKTQGHAALATGKTLTITDLVATAERTQCEAVLLCNEETLNNLVNSSKQVTLDKYRGSRLDYSVPVIVGAPLNHLRNVRHGKWLYEKDIAKFKRIKDKPTQLQFTVCKTTELLNKCFYKITNCLLLSIDIETDAENRITCVGYSALLPNLSTFTFLIPFITFGRNFWDNDYQYELALCMMQQLSRLPCPKLFFNGMYDASCLLRYNAEPLNFVLDAMALAHAQFSELPKTLDFVASYQLYDYYYWKDEADDSKKKGDIHGYWSYCARDCWNTLRVFLSQIQRLPNYALSNYQQLFKMVYPYMYCGFEGVLLDRKVMEENKVKAIAIAEEQKKKLRIMSSEPEFNPGSPKQVGNLLFDIIGAMPVAKRKKKKDGNWTSNRSTDEKAMAKIAGQHPILALFVDAIQEYKEKTKAAGTYFDFEVWNDRLMYGINPFGTDTGRAASRASIFRRWVESLGEAVALGTQIQNIPEYAKNMMIADEGFELAEADNNKSEARCVAFLANCPALKAALADKEKDFYRVLGTIFFGLTYEAVTKELRNKVLKRIVHGRNYLMGADTFVENAGAKELYEGARLLNYPIKSLKEFAVYLLSQYNKPFPELQEWYNETKLEIIRNAQLTSPMGYTRHFFGDIIQDHKVFRNAVAHAPQNLSVMIINKGLWRVYQDLQLVYPTEFRLKSQGHDSIFWQHLIPRREFFIEQVKECMNNPVQVKGDILQIPVDVNTGRTWLELKT